MKDRILVGNETTVVGGSCKTLYKRACEGSSVPSPTPGSNGESSIDVASLPGYGDYWELVDDFDVADKLPYLSHEENLPTCMQGLVWMDQQCTTWTELPGFGMLPWKYMCVTAWGMRSVNEFLTGFQSWDGKCVSFRRDAWTFGQPDIARDVCYYEDVRFCQTNSDTHGPCDEGAYFTMGAAGYDLMKTSFGWDRVSLHLAHYPLLQVVDWQGKKTKWFDYYWNEVSQRQCPSTMPQCRLNQWASTNQTARCLRAVGR